VPERTSGPSPKGDLVDRRVERHSVGFISDHPRSGARKPTKAVDERPRNLSERAVSAERFDNDLSKHGTMSAFAIGDAGGCAAGRE
jgi:hypothetical protein